MAIPSFGFGILCLSTLINDFYSPCCISSVHTTELSALTAHNLIWAKVVTVSSNGEDIETDKMESPIALSVSRPF